MLGGPPIILIESREEGRAPQGHASLVVKNCAAIGTDIWGYDEHYGLDSLTYSCSPEKTTNLFWTQPGRTYGGRVKIMPPVGGTCTITLTNRAGQYITQTISNPKIEECKGNGSNPGNGHPDDNHSAASSPIPAGEFFALPEGARMPPRVAILNHGASHELWLMVLGLGEPAARIDADFDPVATVAQYPVLLIPSGGLYGLENSASFRARLEEYARLGGVIVAFAQQHGYEYGALPGSQVGGYGWSEDFACFDASLYLSDYHPLLSGFDRDTLTVHVDGYFTSIPTGTHTLLSRTANGMPAAVLYPFGAGYVFATTMYDDWDAGHGQSTTIHPAGYPTTLIRWRVDTILLTVNGTPVYSLFIVHSIIVHCPPSLAYTAA